MGLYLSEDGGQTSQVIYDDGVEFLAAGIRYADSFDPVSLPFLSLRRNPFPPPAVVSDSIPLEFWVVSEKEYFGNAYLYRSRDYGITWEPVSIYSQLAVTKHAGPVLSGALLTYTLRVTNTGNVILHTTITDTLPAHIISSTTAHGSVILPGGTLTWRPIITAPAGVWTETVVVTIEKDYMGLLTNVVEVSSVEGATSAYTKTITVYKPWVYLPIIHRQIDR